MRSERLSGDRTVGVGVAPRCCPASPPITCPWWIFLPYIVDYRSLISNSSVVFASASTIYISTFNLVELFVIGNGLYDENRVRARTCVRLHSGLGLQLRRAEAHDIITNAPEAELA